MSESKRKEIGYYNSSTKHVIPGYSATYHALSSSRNELDDNGMVSFVENINGQPRELKANVKGQLMLDRERRGGDRLWIRIYEEADLVSKLEALGVQVSPDSETRTVEQRANSAGPKAKPVEKPAEPKEETVKQAPKKAQVGNNELGFEPVVDDDDAFDAN